MRVFTVGLGTKEGAVVRLEGISMRVQIDEEMLKKIADVTLARFFMADNAEDLRAIYRDVSTRLVAERRETEVSSAFVAARRPAGVAGGEPVGAVVQPEVEGFRVLSKWS